MERFKIYPTAKEYEWVRRLQPGDVVRSGSGMLRIVRKVSVRRTVAATSVMFLIARCSWTGRCYTCLSGNDLRMQGYTRTRAKRIKLDSEFDRIVEHEITFRPTPTEIKLDCCDVKGIA